MTCYQRHITDVFEQLGLEYESGNRRRVDTAIRSALSVPDEAHCPQVWAAIKALSAEDRADLPGRVAKELEGAR